MERSLLPEIAINGGFPEPPADEPVRVVSARHAACGEPTRVRLPGTVPARAVRRLRCAACEQAFECDQVEEVEVEIAEAKVAEPEADGGGPSRPRLPKLALPSLPKLAIPSISIPRPKLSSPRISSPKLPSLKLPHPKLPKLNPQSRTWRLASIPIAAVAVIGGLLLIQGDGERDRTASAPPEQAKSKNDKPAAKRDGGKQANADKVSKNTKLVAGSAYSLALPAGWERVNPPGAATFAAVAGDGGADATLWIEEDPGLEFPAFISQSLRQLEGLAGSARIVERVPAPTAEATIVRLAADAPAGQPTYEVTLRVAGPYRYYLATSVQPDASHEAVRGADLIAGSFTPEGSG